eukprot:4949735-Prymnesium_polylepis.3
MQVEQRNVGHGRAVCVEPARGDQEPVEAVGEAVLLAVAAQLARAIGRLPPKRVQVEEVQVRLHAARRRSAAKQPHAGLALGRRCRRDGRVRARDVKRRPAAAAAARHGGGHARCETQPQGRGRSGAKARRGGHACGGACVGASAAAAAHSTTYSAPSSAHRSLLLLALLAALRARRRRGRRAAVAAARIVGGYGQARRVQQAKALDHLGRVAAHAHRREDARRLRVAAAVHGRPSEAVHQPERAVTLRDHKDVGVV